MNMHANTVGIVPIKKDIYIIKNRINNKVYIGQSKDAANRFVQHCKPSSAMRDHLVIDKAIQKYGAQNFWFEILESQIENYNEREQYWILHYNSIVPNGYNLLHGGEEPPVHYALDSPLSKFDSIAEVDAVKSDLRDTRLSLSQIAQKHNISKRTVHRINQGIHYEKLGEEYPIRKTPLLNGKLSDEDVMEIIEILKHSYRQYEDIALQYGVSPSTIRQINSGDCHTISNVKYPIRNYKNSGVIPCTYNQVTEISDLLADSDISCRQIAKIYGVDIQTIYTINNGNAKRYRRDNYKYPLRKRSVGRRPCIDYPR